MTELFVPVPKWSHIMFKL